MAKKLELKYAIPMMYNTFSHMQVDLDKFKERASEKFKTTKLVLLNTLQTFVP
jgi:L-ascorbate metabolism protein UlaG (beta-lactamase superfamily)